MSKTSIRISGIIPCLNEEGFIAQCLDSLLNQDIGREAFELICVLGPSTDKTAKILAEYAALNGNVRVLSNAHKNTAISFNMGIKAARGNIVFTLGAHTTYSDNYFSKAEQYFEKYECVGSVAKTIPRDSTFIGAAICQVLSSPFGVGNSKMRTGLLKPEETDTASCPGYRKEVFLKIGLFNEDLKHSQDMEFNRRLKLAGGKILATPEIISYYKARSSFISYTRANFINGFWSVYPLKFTKIIPVSARHFTPLVFVFSLIFLGAVSFAVPYVWLAFFAVVFAYLAAAFFFTVKIALKARDPRYIVLLPILFFFIHFPYGIGSLIALTRIYPKKIAV